MSISLGIAQSITGGICMNAQEYWTLFLETGAPEMYLLYNRARRLEVYNVSDIKSPCFEGDRL